MRRGEIVLVFVPFVGAPGGKSRPAVVVQCDSLNAAIRETVIAEVTSNLAHAGKAHQVRIDISTPDGAASGLLTDSAVRCERLHTIPQADVQRSLGFLPATIMQLIDVALKVAMDIP